MPIITVWKQIGETPLQALERARKDYHLEGVEPACFTGRLDPMAQGIQINLFGQDVYDKQDDYNSCSKTYSFMAILGISTTSYDPLGDITDIVDIPYDKAMRFHTAMMNMKGKIIQPFPPCSAYRYKGHPLWWHAKHGSLPIIMPSKEREIYEVKVKVKVKVKEGKGKEDIDLKPVHLPVSTYRRSVISDIKDVQNFSDGSGSDFNCEEVIKAWRGLRAGIGIWRVEYEVTVSSGTYIRSLVHNLGVELGVPAHASRITRLKIGGPGGGPALPLNPLAKLLPKPEGN
jgi:tRNA pseudouridine55 synthase